MRTLFAQLKVLTVQQVVWITTPSSSNLDINIEYLSAIKEKQAEKSFVSHGKLINAQS
jgi:hypothetical protein